ncbi:MAG: alpha/beta hydrolase [Chlorobiaceae bacterium]|jgi:hypothetical protein
MMTVPQNPVVIIPGVLFWDTLYDTMKEAIAVYIPQERVAVAPVSLVDWIGFSPSPERSTNRVMKVVENFFQGDVYHPGRRVGKLITLGTPFHTHEHYAKIKTDFIFSHLTADFFERCHVVSVVCDKYYGNPEGSLVEKMCFRFYKSVLEEGNVRGDGIVPAQSCFLEGAENVTILDAEHLPTPYSRWYGTKEGVNQWIQWL